MADGRSTDRMGYTAGSEPLASSHAHAGAMWTGENWCWDLAVCMDLWWVLAGDGIPRFLGSGMSGGVVVRPWIVRSQFTVCILYTRLIPIWCCINNYGR